MDRRLAGLPPERRLPLRRRRVLGRSGCGTWRPSSSPTASCPTTPLTPGRRGPSPPATSRGSACSDPPGGATPAPWSPGTSTGSTATTKSSPSCGRPWCGGSTTRRRRPGPSATRAEPRPGRRLRTTRSSSGTAAGTGANGASPLLPTTSRGSRRIRATSPRRSCTTPPRSSPASAGCWATTSRPRPSTTSRPRRSDAWRAEYLGDDGSLTARHPGQPRPRPRLRSRARRAPRADRRPAGGPHPRTRAPTSGRASSPPPTSCPCSPTRATSTWPMTCCCRTRRRRG